MAALSTGAVVPVLDAASDDRTIYRTDTYMGIAALALLALAIAVRRKDFAAWVRSNLPEVEAGSERGAARAN